MSFKARRNMAIQWGNAIFTTWDDVPPHIQRQIESGSQAQGTGGEDAAAREMAERLKALAASKSRQRGPRRAARQSSERKPAFLPDIPYNYSLNGMYKAAGKLLGGQAGYCPELRDAAKEAECTLGSQPALRHAGLDEDKLSRFFEIIVATQPDEFEIRTTTKGREYPSMIRQRLSPGLKAAAHRAYQIALQGG